MGSGSSGGKIIILLFLYFLGLQVTPALAQLKTIELAPVMPMSPNASALSVYSDYPVSHYTGIPNISVPLYDLDIDGFKLPIALSYHASGIKVNQEASCVGLGWTLNIGGAISRTVKGHDDFLEYSSDGNMVEGYYHDQDFDNVATNPRYYLAQPPAPTLLVYDTEPDIFYYSLPGAAGKFVIDKTRGAVLMDKNLNVKIEIIHDVSLGTQWNKNLCFQVTTPDGTQYYYKKRETTNIYSYGTKFLNKNSTDPNRQLDDAIGSDSPDTYTSSWLLDKITTVNKRIISFHYERETYESPTQESCIKHVYTSTNGSGGCFDIPADGSVSYSTSKARHETLRLTSITWDGGTVSLTSSLRQDMKGWVTTAPPKKLDLLTIYNQSGEVLKVVNFNYSHFNNDKTGQYEHVWKRLKLDNIVINNDVKHKYLFRYESGGMLAKNSNDLDYWGYYNGKIYGADYYVGLSAGGTIYPGVNKSSNVNFMKIGVLNEIVYPTGGSTSFQYEANTFPENEFSAMVPEPVNNTEKVIEVYNEYSTTGEFEGLPNTDSYQFTIDQPFKISIRKLIENPVCPSFDPDFAYANSGYPIGILKKISPATSVIASYPMPQVQGQNNYCDYAEYDYSTPISPSIFTGPDLSPGTYVFEALTPPKNIYVRWRLNFLYNQPPVSPNNPVAGGGLRVSKITTGNQIKNYTYPTGKLMVTPALAYGKRFTCFDEFNGYTTQIMLAQLSNSIIPLSTLRNSNSVGYDWVEESMTGAGKTRYTFYNDTEEPMYEAPYAESSFPYAPTSINYQNGLIKQIDYFKDTNIIMSTEFSYQPSYSATIQGYMYNGVSKEGFWYGYKFNWLMKSAEVTKTFFSDAEVEEVTLLTYNDHFQLKSKKKMINGEWDEQRTRYATDFSDAVSQSMTAKHMISVPLETIRLKNNQVIGGQKVSFIDTLGLCLSKAVYSLKAPTPLSETNYQNNFQKEVEFDRYSPKAKVLQMRNKGNMTSFVWGYNDYCAIAKIVNGSYAQVLGLLGEDNLRDLEENPNDMTVDANMDLLRSSLVDAHITSYTHRPQIGITSETNERGVRKTFGYDINNRLAYIKDYQGDLLKFYNYNYRGADHPYGPAESDLPTSIPGLAWLEDNNGGVYPGKFRVTLVNTVTSATYIFDIDENVKRFGGIPWGSYNVSIVSLENRPISDFSLQVWGEEGPGGIVPVANIDEGSNLFQIFKN